MGAVVAGVLAYGAHTRNSKAMLIYMRSATIFTIAFIIRAVWAITSVINKNNIYKKTEKACEELRGTNDYKDCLDAVNDAANAAKIWIFPYFTKFGETSGYIIFAIFAVGVIIFYIWTIIVAKKAKKEIEAEAEAEQ